MKPFALLTIAALAFALVSLHACQETPELTQPSSAVAPVRYKLTVSGAGTGSGAVTSVPAGINCTITAGTAATTGCSALFNKGVNVTLTAKPIAGHSFTAWGKHCSGTGTCIARMTAARAVSARFLKGPFKIDISAGTTGGSGTVKSQSGLTPVINCVISAGVVATKGCAASYPAYVSLVLTASPAPGHAFVGWGAPCSGTGTCQITVTKRLIVPAKFAPLSAAQPGEWTAPFDWPVVGVHLHLLPNNQILSWGLLRTPHVWDPSENTFTSLSSTTLLVCSGHAFLPDGKLMVIGGHIKHDQGLPDVNIFDQATRIFTRVAPMAQGRWYPTATALANGEIVAVGGADAAAVMVAVPEVWNGSSWRQLTGASLQLPYYPWLFQAPNGKVFYAGWDRVSRYLGTEGQGSWEEVATSGYGNREAGTAVMYEPGKVLIVGGGGGRLVPNTPPTATAETIDLNSAAPAWRSTGSMAFPRRHLNATLLPTGEVLVTGGTAGVGFNNPDAAVHPAEIWNPSTGTWKTLASNTINRIYHSTAILLPSGKVLVAGAGENPGDVDQFNAELYSPPYLFRGTRPTLSSVPTAVTYGSSFSVVTPDAVSIGKVTLLRLGSVTHSFNQNQRFISLSFEQAVNGLSVSAPASGNLAPPGYYLMFLVNLDGVPSVGSFVRVQ